MSHKHLMGLLGAVGLGLGHATAQSAALVWGGNPKVLSKESSVHMDSEKIKLKIGHTWTSVTCAFVLRNDGPACKVRIGFPDQGWGPKADSDDEDAKLGSFQAFVDGKKTTTEPVSGEEGGASIVWHERTIPFTRHQTRYILDQYKVRTGTAIASGNIPIHEVAFLMHTGSSWKGPIKKVNVVAEFDEDLVPDDITAEPARQLHVKWATDYDGWDQVSRGTVYYHAFARPSVDGTTLTFDAHNLQPSARSDIYLYCRAGRGRPHQHSVAVVNTTKRRRHHVHQTLHHQKVFHPEETEQ
jgi:hypothetical protein